MRASDGALLIVALVIAWSLYRAHREPGNQFNLMDLLMENGRVSRIAAVFLASFTVTSWVLVKVTIEGKLTEALFMAYAGVWVAPIIAKMFGTASAPAEPKP